MMYFARAGCFNIAWWIGNAGVLRLGSRRTVQIYNPLRRRRRLGRRFLCHVELLDIEMKKLDSSEESC